MTTNYSDSSEAFLSTVVSSTDGGDSNVKPWDNSDPFFSAETRIFIKMLFRCYIRQIIIFFGVPGNALSCAVFMKQGLSTNRINLLLFWLAVADLSNLLTHALWSPSCYMSDGVQARNWDTLTQAKIVHVNMCFIYTSGCLILVMSVDRCLSVVMPLRAKRLLTYRAMVVFIILSYLIPFLCFLPTLLAYKVGWREDPSTGRSIAYMTLEDWFTVDSRILQLISYFYVLVIFPTSFVVVVVCCITTIIYLRRAALKRVEMMENVKEDEGAREARITKMLLFLCGLYAVLLIPEICAALASYFVPEFYLFKKYHNSFSISYQALIFTASCLNSAANFFAYLVLSSSFRGVLKNWLFSVFRKSG
ncbi:uncharacterized protein LOC143290129 [Babylonia areolata]|uniref:uncharacterized protein LOC143290129 n=1 Tax=Babylonia areolata TaxID=304850 RepID=UPI003FD54B49